MSFMQPQLTEYDHWLVIETTDGTYFLDWDLAGSAKDYIENPEDIAFSAVANELHIYTEVGPDGIEDISDIWGYGARLSAPGYSDQTYWAVFKTQKEAAQHLLDMYGNDDTPEDWQAEIEQIANS